MTKIEKLRHEFDKLSIDAFLITNPFNRRYMTNFTGTAGLVFITKKKAYFITDFRYTEQAQEQAKGFEIIEHKGAIMQEVNQLIEANDVKAVGFEKTDVTYALYETIKESFKCELVATSQVIENIRLVKTPDELAILKEAAKIADDAYEHILNFVKPGMKEIEVANELEFFMRKQGATSSSFDIIVASGYRSALPHGVASNKEIQLGELVTLDYGALYNGYISDITRTFAVGEVSEQLKEIYDVVLEAQIRGVEGIKPGMTGKEADALTRDYITDQGYGEYFGHSTGHGIGLEVHEGPGLSTQSDVVLKENMVVTVEPGIYIANVGGCRIEDDIYLTEDGNERLTFATKEFIQL